MSLSKTILTLTSLTECFIAESTLSETSKQTDSHISVFFILCLVYMITLPSNLEVNHLVKIFAIILFSHCLVCFHVFFSHLFIQNLVLGIPVLSLIVLHVSNVEGSTSWEQTEETG